MYRPANVSSLGEKRLRRWNNRSLNLTLVFSIASLVNGHVNKRTILYAFETFWKRSMAFSAFQLRD